MKIKTSELTGAALDWAVAKSKGNTGDFGVDGYSPSTNWAQGGPIIERDRIWLQPEVSKEGTASAWYAVSMHNTDAFGSTPLIAAMRCYVAAKLGDEVEIPQKEADHVLG